MELAIAQAVASQLPDLFAVTGEGVIAGSVRRKKPNPRDIELLMPFATDRDDVVYEAIEPYVYSGDDYGLFAAPRRKCESFRAVKGFKRYFWYCQLVCDYGELLGRVGHGFKVDIFRYVPELPFRNFGWQLLIRTGSADFSHACASHWQRQGGRSETGYLIDENVKRWATNSEQEAFEILGIEWVEPEDRHGGSQVRPIGHLS